MDAPYRTCKSPRDFCESLLAAVRAAPSSSEQLAISRSLTHSQSVLRALAAAAAAAAHHCNPHPVNN